MLCRFCVWKYSSAFQDGFVFIRMNGMLGTYRYSTGTGMHVVLQYEHCIVPGTTGTG